MPDDLMLEMIRAEPLSFHDVILGLPITTSTKRLTSDHRQISSRPIYTYIYLPRQQNNDLNEGWLKRIMCLQPRNSHGANS